MTLDVLEPGAAEQAAIRVNKPGALLATPSLEPA